MRPPPALLKRLHAVRRRWFTVVLLQVVARILACASLVIVAAALADRWLGPDGGALLLLAAVAAFATIAVVGRIAWPYRRAPSDLQVARFVEERCPEMDDLIATAVDLSHRAASNTAGGLGPLVLERAVSRLSETELAQLVPTAELRTAAGRALFAGAGLAVVAVLTLPFSSRVLEVARLRYLPGTVGIRVQPGDTRIPVGRPLRIVARLEGRSGTLTRVSPIVTIESGGQHRSLPMDRTNGEYEVKINAVDRSFGYRVEAGNAASPRYTVTALVPPRVKRIDLHYDYPSFTGLAPRDERNGGDVFGPAGTRVRLRVTTDKPVTAGRLAMSEGPATELTRADDRSLESTITVSGDAAYRVALADADGLTSEGIEYFIRLMDDRPPEVHVLRPMGDQQITPLEEVTIEARADDDYGIAGFELVYSVAGGREKVVPFTTRTGTSVAQVGLRLLAAEELGVQPGDVVTYYARARDVARGKPSTLSRSEIFFLEVKPFNEEYTAAQSQAMAAATGTELESLIAAQKDVISATWNLERRSVAGRSAADIKAVADAQAEVKGRAEQATGALRPRRRGSQFPQQATTQGATGGNPVSEAVVAMGRAVQQLEGRHTAEAMPHEMAALSALLKAEAEIRRRQVTQQANGTSSAGNGWQGQDLSSLFDRELKRQQRTNYETRSQIEQRPEEQNDERALDRIRELARRQEELNRQQRDLAGSELSAEEVKRELEKLTREQTELRKQAEELAARRAQAAQGAAGAPDAMTKAAEQMRSAASELRREDPASAAARGEQAATELRNLERQMQSASPDARRRALGELQLDAQQITDAQRRIASEAEHLDREGGGTADARRRLAGEKEQLADRVDALRDAARRLAADPKSGVADRAAVTEATGAIDRQRLTDRMRATARQMRDGAAPGDRSADTKPEPLAGAESQLADALARVAKQLNAADAGGAKGETQRLADQLDQARDAKDRLARLEKQISDLQKAAAPPDQRGGRAGSEGPQGRAQRGSQGESDELTRLRQAYGQELRRTRDLVAGLQRSSADSGGAGSTPEEHEWSRSAPGTEAWKQDYAAWGSLSKDVKQALERYESSTAERLSRALTADRLRAGGSDRVPDAYQRRISKYFELLAKIRAEGPDKNPR
jgi:archaellum component FlaC